MKKVYVLLFALIALQVSSQAQCTGNRYKYVTPPAFSSYDSSTVTYSTVYNQQMNIFQPHNDPSTSRPLVILAHGGSFVGGSRTSDVSIRVLTENLAKRGYVTASIDYRLATGAHTLDLLDSTKAPDIVMKAISDGKAAIRYFKLNAATYRIDTNHIYFGGNSAGAVLAVNAGYIDANDTIFLRPVIRNAINQNGGLEGNSGNMGPSSSFRALINLAGAVSTLDEINTGGLPIVSCQGDKDSVVPYTCAYPEPYGPLLPVPLILCGLGSMEPVLNAKGIYNEYVVFPGDGHTPWEFDAAKMARVDSVVTDFLYNVNCTSGINNVSEANNVSVYPNPSNGSFNIKIEGGEQIGTIQLFDQLGRTVLVKENTNASSLLIEKGSLSTGIYLLKLNLRGTDNSTVIKRIVIQ